MLFRQWYMEVVDSGIPDPTIMTLATVDKTGRPSARIVLLKEFDERGFVFYSNYHSSKAEHLGETPWAALVIHWQPTGHQVRIEGKVEMTSGEESDRYFATRPRSSQLGAWASEQSRIVPSRESLDEAFRKTEEKYRDKDVPRPPHWGGFRLDPDRMEFWVSREDRMHDRIVYEKNLGLDKSRGDSKKDLKEWIIRRLAP